MLKKISLTLLSIFVALNIIAYNHAYHFTHFTDQNAIKTQAAESLSLLAKIGILFTGISNPKPKNDRLPDGDFETLTITSPVIKDTLSFFKKKSPLNMVTSS